MTLTVVDGDLNEGSEWPYPWERDGLCYKSCTRCGIRLELPEHHLWSSTSREFCDDCTSSKSFLAPFQAGGAVNYLSVAA